MIQLTGDLEIEGQDVSAFVHSMIIRRTRNSVTVPPTLANIREVTKAGALVESLEIRFHSSLAASSLWAELYDAIDTDSAELTFVGKLNPGAVGVDNPEFSGSFVVMGIDTGADVGALREQTQTYAITADGIDKAIST
jgi:hypothetical protein